MTRKQVVVIGAGFGGLAAAKGLRDADADVVLVDQRNHHTFQPLLYQVATAGLDADDICYTTRGILRRQANGRALQATVCGIDLIERHVLLTDGDPLPYDQLVIATGAVTNDFGVPGVADHTLGLKSAAEALHIRNQVLSNFERAAQASSPSDHARLTTVVIVGGGPTGVEMAGGFAELFEKVLPRDFPEVVATAPRVILVEGQGRLLGAFKPALGDKALRRLQQMGVEVRLQTQVASVGAGHVELSSGDRLATDTVVWAAGIKPHPLVASLGFETTRGGRIVVDEHLRVAGHPNIFAIGDLAAAKTDGELIPQVAPGAMQAGEHVARFIAGETADPFEYRDKGSMATIGRNAAVVQLPNGRTASGFVGWAAWLTLHLLMLVGVRNRANVLVNWAWSYLTYDRASRSIIDEVGTRRVDRAPQSSGLTRCNPEDDR